MLFGLLSVFVLGACAPAPEPEPEPVVEEAAPPPPPPTTYELTEVVISEEEPDFTSQNVTILGVTLGDSTNAVVENLGEQTGTTIVGEDDYLTVYQEGGLILYTHKQTGIARRIELATPYADEIADPNLMAWLENGDQAVLREWLGAEEALENVPENNNATEFAYDSRVLWLVKYLIEGQDCFAGRFSQIP